MRITSPFIIVLLLLSTALGVLGQNSPEKSNPLGEYIHDLDEMGRTLSGWEGDDVELGSWFFSSYAMLILQNNGSNVRQPFPTMETLIPELWSDFKYINPRYLVELAGGALSFNDMMLISRERPFRSLRTEEQFILHVAGMSYLRMLESTVGDSTFKEIINSTLQSTQDPTLITSTIIQAIKQHAGVELSEQFRLVLSSGSWMDIELQKVRKNGDSLDIYIKHNGAWSFPVDVLMITETGDSSSVIYGLNEAAPLRVPNLDYHKIILDPDHKLAEFYRFNNKWPRFRDNVFIQPFAALPDWEYYRVVLSPSAWSDWDGEKRYALKMTSGFGVDLWPAYPSDFRHRISLELNAHSPVDASTSWGARFSYDHPILLQKRLFAGLNLHTYDDWSGASMGVTKYVGKQSFLVQGPRLRYQRVSAAFEVDRYRDSLIWRTDQDINIFKASYSGLSLTRFGDRLYIKLNSAIGSGPEGQFSMMKSQIDLSGVFWKWLVSGVQIAYGTQGKATPSPYQFTHNYAWQDGLAALPRFRGQSRLNHQANNYMGLSVSGGYWLSWVQIKLFASSMIYDQNGLELSQAIPQHAAGVGFEHKSFFTAGLYFPVWQSHPIEGEESWAWRYQWRLTWNL